MTTSNKESKEQTHTKATELFNSMSQEDRHKAGLGYSLAQLITINQKSAMRPTSATCSRCKSTMIRFTYSKGVFVMSKDNFCFIDDTLRQFHIHSTRATGKKYTATHQSAKQALIQGFKAAMLEVIGEDEYPDEHFPTVLSGKQIERYDKVTARDRLRATQRTKLDQLSKETE